MKNQKTKGFKGFKKGLKCRDKQYAENADFEEDVKPVACSIGMHFCENPLDVFNYYPPSGQNEYAEVESIGDSVKKEDKTVTNKLSIKSKISIAGLFKMHFASIFKGIEASPSTINTSGYEAHANTSGYEAHANTSGKGAHANTSGDEAHANTSGYEAHANTSGDHAHANTSGDEAHANTSGYEAHANTSGDHAHANTSGYEAHANTSGKGAHANTSGDEAHANTSGYEAHANTSGDHAHANTSGDYAYANTSGDEAVASATGYGSRAKAKKGWIIIVDWGEDENRNRYIIDIKRAKVGKHKIQNIKIEPDTWYWFENGKLKSEKACKSS